MFRLFRRVIGVSTLVLGGAGKKGAAGGTARNLIEVRETPAGRAQGGGVGVSSHGVRDAWTSGETRGSSRGTETTA
jgi:hypothetical protein